jgi:SAM-dependent methyltransferase
MAPGGLLLAHQMAEQLALTRGSTVIDLGCGRGQSSVFLATEYEAPVVSIDLWVSAEDRRRAAAAAGVAGRITPLQGDIRRGLPVAAPLADAIFCMQAFHTFGAHSGLLRYLASLLKPGGRLCFAQGCFSEEPDGIGPPFTDTGGWDVRYETYHSPAWWRTHVESSGAFAVETCDEVPDGDILWEDDVLYRGDRAGWSEQYLARSGWLMRHILHGRSSRPALTHMMLVASRRQGPAADTAAPRLQ